MLNHAPLREPAPQVPSCRRHKPTGQAVVTLNGRERTIFLGPKAQATCCHTCFGMPRATVSLPLTANRSARRQ